MIDDPLHQVLRASLQEFPLKPSGLAPVLRPLEGIQAVVFDFYDTLILTETSTVPAGMETDVLLGSDLARRVRLAGGKLPARASDFEAAWSACIAATHRHRRESEPDLVQPEVHTLDVVRDFCQASLSDNLASEVAARREAWTTRSRRAPGARAMLGKLRARGLTLGIGSNAQRVSESLFSLHFGGKPEALGLTLNVWSWRLGVAKPDPAFFRHLAKLAAGLGITPARLLFVGNDPSRDIAPAANAGFATCLYAGDQRCLRPSGSRTPDAVITCFSQLDGILR
ncbi:MAG: HAD family hydrolase [Verrucomicrobiales bacterium]